MLDRQTPLRNRRPRRLAAALAVSVVLALAALELVTRLYVSAFNHGELQSTAERDQGTRSTAQRIFEQRPEAIVVFDSDLGWRPQPNIDNGVDHINSQGIRSAREYDPKPKPSVTRVAVFGDSFVYGTEVSTLAAWPSVLERNVPNLEILNYGVPGYGPDQAYLRFQRTADDLNPKVVVLGISTPSLVRILTVSPVFQSSDPHFISKPRFTLTDTNELKLIPNPLRTVTDVRRYVTNPGLVVDLGHHDYWYEPLVHANPTYDAWYTMRLVGHGWSKAWRRHLDSDRPLAGPPGQGVFNERSAGFRILTRLIDNFVKEARELGMTPIVALLPDGYSIEALRQGHREIMAPVHDYCVQHGIRVANLSDAFMRRSTSIPLEEWFFGKFHYTEGGNKIVASRMAKYLDNLDLSDPGH